MQEGRAPFPFGGIHIYGCFAEGSAKVPLLLYSMFCTQWKHALVLLFSRVGVAGDRSTDRPPSWLDKCVSLGQKSRRGPHDWCMGAITRVLGVGQEQASMQCRVLCVYVGALRPSHTTACMIIGYCLGRLAYLSGGPPVKLNGIREQALWAISKALAGRVSCAVRNAFGRSHQLDMRVRGHDSFGRISCLGHT